MANRDIKTMNPADKFLTPRQPPPAPAKDTPRLNTSTSVLVKSRSARSLSPKGEKPQWTPRAFFGLRSPPVSPAQPLERKASEKRGRSSSLRKANKELSTASTPNLRERSENERKIKSVPHTRNTSPRSFESSNSREPASVHRQDSTTYTSKTTTIPEEVIEDIDDYNFADQFSRFSTEGRGITPLAPPPSSLRRSPSISIRTTQGTSKPLPELPEVSLMPPPLRLAFPLDPIELQPRLHFSTSTISSSLTSSPIESHSSFGFEEKDSDFASIDEDDLAVDASSGDEFTYSPLLSEVPTSGFSGYSLPEADYSSEQTIRKQPALSTLSEVASRKPFGSPLPSPSNSVVEVERMSALAQLMKEMGYLGDVIVGN